MSAIKDNYPKKGRNFKHGIGFQNRCSVCDALELIVVFSSHEIKQKYWDNQKVPRSCQKKGTIMDAIVRPFGGRAHTEIVHVDIGGKSPAPHILEVESKQGDERMEGERELHTIF